MNIRINKDLLIEHKPFFDKYPFAGDKEANRWRDFTDIDITMLSPKDLERLIKQLEKMPKIRTAKSLIRDLGSYKEAIAAGKSQTVEKLTHLIPALTEYIRPTPNKHIYKRDSEGGFEAYYVDHMYYDPGKKPTKKDPGYPPSVRVYLKNRKYGNIRDTSLTYHSSDVVGKTAGEILMNDGYYLENENLRTAYKERHNRYIKTFNNLGEQFLARGAGHTEDEDRAYWRRSSSSIPLEVDGQPSRVVVDVLNENGSKEKSKDTLVRQTFWHASREREEPESAEDEDDTAFVNEEEETDDEKVTEDDIAPLANIPVVPMLMVFDLKRHIRYEVHISQLEAYVYNTKLRDSLVLPERHLQLIDALLADKKSTFQDIIEGKSGGVVVLLQGRPGTGKTLTAEIYAEAMERPLYMVQCSQLGLDADTLEKNLKEVLIRGSRWGAVMLLDEADVYVHERGSDLLHNAIVGVFLRVLEYQTSVLFLTTNRGDLVDDAILSRCTARIEYKAPEPHQQALIWAILAKSNGIKLPQAEIDKVVINNPTLSGRDIKNLLKLAGKVAASKNCSVDATIIEEVKEFKPS